MTIYIDDYTGEVSYEEPSLGPIIVGMWIMGCLFPLGLALSMAIGWYSV